MNMINVLIIGYGSIGKKHEKVLMNIKAVNKIYILTNQNKIKNKNFISSYKDMIKIKPDYFIISCETSKHFFFLKYIDQIFRNKIILIEKPLFDKPKSYKVKNNIVKIGYNLRFHPVITYLKDFLKNKKVYSSLVVCNSFLPKWRNNVHYTKSYSADIKKGGGVIHDLSHELDYSMYLFGKLKHIFSDYDKISFLKISSPDYASILLSSTKVKKILINLNYFSLIEKRKIFIDGYNFSLEADLINNNIKLQIKNNIKIIKFAFNAIDSYKSEHKFMLNKRYNNLCSYEDGKSTLDLINKIIKRKKI